MDKNEQPAVEYEAPKIEDYGDLKELTAGASRGGYLDKAFPAGTAFSQLTFSG